MVTQAISDTLTEILSFDEFKGLLAEVLEISEERISPESFFVTDLGADSIRMVEVLLMAEERLGMNIPPEAAWDIQTVGDAYQYYLSHRVTQA